LQFSVYKYIEKEEVIISSKNILPELTYPQYSFIIINILYSFFRRKKYLFFYFNIINNFFKLKLLIFFKRKNILFSKSSDLKQIISKRTKFKYKIKKFKFFKTKNKYSFKNNQIIDNTFKFLNVIINNRKIIRNIFFNKFTRERKITKFLVNFSKKNNNSINRFYNFLFIILIQSQFFFFINDINFFLKGGFIFVNNKIVCNRFFEVKINDCVKLVRYNTYYDYISRVHKFFKKKIAKMKYKGWLSYKLRQKNIYTKYWLPNFLDKFFFYKSDIPKYLQVDFFTLTIIYIYYEDNILNKNKFFYNLLSFYMIKLYNWKKLH